MSHSARIRAIVKRLPDFMHDIDRLLMNGRTDVLQRVDGPLKSIETGLKWLEDALAPGVGEVHEYTDAESCASLLFAMERIAKGCGSALYPPDSLRSLVVEYAAPEDQAHWHSLRPERIVGLLSYRETVVRELLKKGILAWTNEADRKWRIVDTHWLTSHAEIRAFIAGPRAHGRICQFCQIQENQRVNELQMVELERRHGVTMIGDVVALPTGGVLTHTPCVPYWLEWVRLASTYPSQQTAAEADEKAGRISRTAPAREALERL